MLYLLVRTNNTLKYKSILCLYELHAAFAHVRVVGVFINDSVLKKAWQVAGWFHSSACSREIIECRHIKQAITTHEQSAFGTEDVTSYIETTNRALEENHHIEF